MYSSLIFKSDTKAIPGTLCTVFSMYISTDVDSAARIQKQTRPRFTRPTLITDISPWDTYSGLPVGHTDRKQDSTHPVVVSSWDIEVIRDNTVVVQMDP